MNYRILSLGRKKQSVFFSSSSSSLNNHILVSKQQISFSHSQTSFKNTIQQDFWLSFLKESSCLENPPSPSHSQPPSTSSPSSFSSSSLLLPELKSHPHEPINQINHSNREKTRNAIVKAIRLQRDNEDVIPFSLANSFMTFYHQLNFEQKHSLLKVISRDFGCDKESIAQSCLKYANLLNQHEHSPSVLKLDRELRNDLKPPYESLFEQIIKLPDGLQFMIRLRADLLDMHKKSKDKYLQSLEESIRDSLHIWFGSGHLQLKQINWDITPAYVLEKIAEYEAVHKVGNWQDLKLRVSPGRLCFSFFHKSIPSEPLAFVHIILSKDHIHDNIHTLLKTSSHLNPIETQSCNTAIFYTITSSQRGLSGIDLGNMLIKSATKQISKMIPTLKTFMTLSPIPGFRSWLASKVNYALDHSDSSFCTEHEFNLISQLNNEVKTKQNALTYLKHICLSYDSLDYKDNHTLKSLLMNVVTRYLLVERRRSLAFDPVANFHIRNGALVYQLNWNADRSVKGREQSFGIMVNYHYRLDKIEDNNQNYLVHGKIPIHANNIHTDTLDPEAQNLILKL